MQEQLSELREQRQAIAPHGIVVRHHQHLVEELIDDAAQAGEMLECLRVTTAGKHWRNVGPLPLELRVQRVLGCFREARRIRRRELRLAGLPQDVRDPLVRRSQTGTRFQAQELLHGTQSPIEIQRRRRPPHEHGFEYVGVGCVMLLPRDSRRAAAPS